jgi:hypothetical protein
VSLDGNLYLEMGVLATNGARVQRAVRTVKSLGVRVLSCTETRTQLNLPDARSASEGSRSRLFASSASSLTMSELLSFRLLAQCN